MASHLREAHRLKITKNKLLKRISGLKRRLKNTA
jgi:hypothetical protein